MAEETSAQSTETQTDTSADETTTSANETQSTDQTGSSTTEKTDDEATGLASAKAEGDETKTEGDETKTEGDDKGEAAELFGAPAEDAAYEITGLPEGMSIDEAALKAADPLFRELNLSPAGASKIAQVYAEHILPSVVQQTTEAVNEAMKTAVLDERKRMETEARAFVKNDGKDDKGEPVKTGTGDPISFDNNDMKKVMAIAARAMDRVMPAGFREYLEETGLQFDKRMIAGMYAVGKLVSEDTTMDRSTTSKTKSDADLFYG